MQVYLTGTVDTDLAGAVRNALEERRHFVATARGPEGDRSPEPDDRIVSADAVVVVVGSLEQPLETASRDLERAGAAGLPVAGVGVAEVAELPDPVARLLGDAAWTPVPPDPDEWPAELSAGVEALASAPRGRGGRRASRVARRLSRALADTRERGRQEIGSAPPPAGKTVFLSYSSDDRERAEEVQADLEEAGVKVWVDKPASKGATSGGPASSTASATPTRS